MKLACLALALAMIVVAQAAGEGPDVVLQINADPVGSPTAIAIRIDGKSLSELWTDTFSRLFADLDRDGDGFLSQAEISRMPSSLRVRQMAWGYLFSAPAKSPRMEELDRPPTDGRVTREEMIAYYGRGGIGDVHVVLGRAPGTDNLTRALVRQLDRDGDGRLNQKEVEAAETVLRALDADADELIRPSELVTRLSYPGVFGTTVLATAPETATPPSPVSRLPAESSAKPETAHFLTVHLGQRQAGQPAVQAVGGTRQGFSVEAAPDSVTLRSGKVIVSVGTAPSQTLEEFSLTSKLALERFKEADKDRDGVLSQVEVEQSGFAPLSNFFASADRDGDGRLRSQEWEACLDGQSRLLAAQVSITVLDHGSGLFEFLDADRDGALSVRELREAWARLKRGGCVVDGVLDLAGLPRQVRLTVSQARPKSLTRIVPRTGPQWFRAMDRNGDGDVSRREFIGSQETFRRIDTDNDGLISPAEAARAVFK